MKKINNYGTAISVSRWFWRKWYRWKAIYVEKQYVKKNEQADCNYLLTKLTNADFAIIFF